MEEACNLLAAVDSFAISRLPSLARDSRDLKKAQDVSRVFKFYESCLRSRSSSESELTNKQGDLVRLITRSAQNALESLNSASQNASLSLDRAYAYDENVENNLGLLVESLEAVKRWTEGRREQPGSISVVGGVGAINAGESKVQINNFGGVGVLFVYGSTYSVC